MKPQLDVPWLGDGDAGRRKARHGIYRIQHTNVTGRDGAGPVQAWKGGARQGHASPGDARQGFHLS